MLSFKLALRSLARQKWRLATVIIPTALLFAMVTFALATAMQAHAIGRQLNIERSLRMGSVTGYVRSVSQFTPPDLNKLGAIPGVAPGPGSFIPCGVDPNKPNEFICGASNRAYLQVHDYSISTTAEQLDRWDAVRNGAIVVRSVAEKHRWKVGDPITLRLQLNPPRDLQLVITSIQDEYRETGLYYHYEYLQQLVGNVAFYSIWLLVDSPEHRQAVMDQVDAEFAAVHRPYTLWKGEDVIKMALGSSKTLNALFEAAGLVSGILVLCLAVTLLIVSIEQRRTEYATLMAIGYRRSVIAASILIEGMVLLSISAAIGAFGTFLVFHASELEFSPVMQIHISEWLAAVVTGGGLALGLVSAAIPGWRSLRLDILSALRS